MSLLIDHPRLFTIVKQFVRAEITIDSEAQIDVLPVCQAYGVEFEPWIYNPGVAQWMATMAERGVIPEGQVANIRDDSILVHHQVAIAFLTHAVPQFGPWWMGIVQGIMSTIPAQGIEMAEAKLASVMGEKVASRMLGTAPTGR